eukprot:1107421-Prorocentrum_minimum.AAC.1
MCCDNAKHRSLHCQRVTHRAAATQEAQLGSRCVHRRTNPTPRSGGSRGGPEGVPRGSQGENSADVLAGQLDGARGLLALPPLRPLAPPLRASLRGGTARAAGCSDDAGVVVQVGVGGHDGLAVPLLLQLALPVRGEHVLGNNKH